MTFLLLLLWFVKVGFDRLKGIPGQCVESLKVTV